MSRHSSHRLNLTYKAILATMLGFGGLHAHALSLGQANVQSEQHQPLSASISVSGIDAKSFKASLADSGVYEQMGLSQNARVQVRFEPTSDTSGKIILSSSEPISTPFTDVVLNLNNNGEERIEPQTLLMPLPKQAKVPDTAPVMVAAENEQDLPVVTPINNDVELEPVMGEPLVVQSSAPPPLFEEVPNTEQASTTQAPNTQATNTQTTNSQMVQTSEPTAPVAPAKVLSEKEKVLASIVPEGVNKQVDVLTEQVTRRIYPAGTAPTTPAPMPTDGETVATQTPSDVGMPTQTPTQGTSATYVVQRGDSLWSIANQIAKANNMSVEQVMKELHAQNPEAFNRGKANQLKTNATLNIPSYEVIPSQKAIQEAISTRKKTSTTKKSSASTSNKSVTAQSKRTRKPSKPLPKAQMTLVTPGTSAKATGGQGGDNGGQLVSTLKSTRSQAVQSAKRVNSLKQDYSAAAQKLQLQNQKLAELEARLKALKDK